jgi:hypothetical protein
VHNFMEYVESDDDFFDQTGKGPKAVDDQPITHESLKRQMQLLISERDNVRTQMAKA